MIKSYKSDVCAVVVTYQPDFEVLGRQLDVLVLQVDSIVIVDNGSRGDLVAWHRERNTSSVEVRLLGENRGIAAAQNVGIEWARTRGAEFVLLMDQDSIPEPEMVDRLCASYKDLTDQGISVAAVGPRYRDCEHGALSRFVKTGFLGFTLLDCNPGQSVVEADFLISSGALLPLSVIDTVGLMDEGLFIDHVDTEWCFRAKAKGFCLFGVCAAVMTHTLGEQRKGVWFLRRRVVSFHNPFRYYYIYRNSTLLYFRGYMPGRWKLADLSRCIKMTIYFGLASPNRFACLKMMALGAVDGLKGVTGRRDRF
jgi:rhamnosyltransferase